MHLDYRDGDRGECVANRDARVGVGTRIYQDQVRAIASLLDAIDDGALGIRLKAIDRKTQLAPQPFQLPVDIAKPDTAIDFWFALSEEVQVGPVNHQDPNRSPALGFAVAPAAPGSILLPRHVPAQLLAALNPTAPSTSSRFARAHCGRGEAGIEGGHRNQ